MQTRFSVITLFPEMFSAIQNEGVISRAIKSNAVLFETVYLRDFSQNARKNVDDHPAGGGDGMVLRADITEKAIESVKGENSFIIHMTPTGKVFDNKIARSLAQKKHLVFLCGRYAGFDHRVVKKHAHLNLSVGDFVLSGGELASMCVIDSVARFLPNTLGNEKSAACDSFEDNLLEAPQYTKPNEFSGEKIPQVLLSGDHKKIASYNRTEQIKLTAQNRPDLILEIWDQLSKQEKTIAEKIWKHGTGN